MLITVGPLTKEQTLVLSDALAKAVQLAEHEVYIEFSEPQGGGGEFSVTVVKEKD